MDPLIAQSVVETSNYWHEWIPYIPWIHFPCHFDIKIIPPYGGAMVRFEIRLHNQPNRRKVDVYLDCNQRLGFFDDKAYWEVSSGERFEISDVKNMIQHIDFLLQQ